MTSTQLPPLIPLPLPVAPSDVQLFVHPEPDPNVSALAPEILDASEMARADRFQFDGDRIRFLQAHILKRRALSLLAPDVMPSAWRFDLPERNGKPFAMRPDGLRGPEFSMTHCAGLVGIAASCQRAVGLDAEPTQRPELSAALAKSSFAPVELAHMDAAPAQDILARLWCGKEALAKGVGQGLALDFGKIILDVDNARLLSAPPPLTVADWTLSYPPAPLGFTLALAWKDT